MPLKKTIRIIGIAALLASTASGLNSAPYNSLENAIAGEAMQQQSAQQESASVRFTVNLRDWSDYLQAIKQFNEADSMGQGKLIIDKVSYEYNDFYKNICTVYTLKDVQLYKPDNNVLSSTQKVIDFRTRKPGNLTIIYKATKPGANIPPEVIATAKKAGLAAPITDEATPTFEEGDEYFVFIQNIPAKKGTGNGLIHYMPANDKNKADIEKIVNDYKIRQ